MTDKQLGYLHYLSRQQGFAGPVDAWMRLSNWKGRSFWSIPDWEASGLIMQLKMGANAHTKLSTTIEIPKPGIVAVPEAESTSAPLLVVFSESELSH
jgi:hypothetical protein